MNADFVVPFGDLSAEVREIRSEVDHALARVLDSGWFVLGKELDTFERQFAEYVGVPYTVGCASGTDAITLALRALGVGPSDEVITVANTCVPTAAGIRDAGCTLRLVDCDARTLQMSPEALAKAITPRTCAIVPVHLYGSSPDMAAITAVAERAGIPVVEDCAQAHGASFGGRSAGSWGILAAWSFYPSKNLGAYGDGGAVTTGTASLADRLVQLRNYGQRVRYYHDEEGRNSRLDELQAALLQVKLAHLERWNERRRRIAQRYRQGLGSIVDIPAVDDRCVPSFHLFPIRVPSSRRGGIRERLESLGIMTQIHYPVPVHRQKAYAHMFVDQTFPHAEAAAGELISLPMFPQLSEAQVDHVIASVKTVVQR